MRDLLGVVPEVMDATKQFSADQETHALRTLEQCPLSAPAFITFASRPDLSGFGFVFGQRSRRPFLEIRLEDFTKDTRGMGDHIGF